ncbi:MAG: hypothetical protein ABJA86_06025 [Nocardioidaceae bacterium]
MTVQIRAREPRDDAIVERLLHDSWGDMMVVSRGLLQDARLLPGFIATDGGTPAGLGLDTRCVPGIQRLSLAPWCCA